LRRGKKIIFAYRDRDIVHPKMKILLSFFPLKV